ncbi:MAG: alpha/beta hydrolase [Gammaproteobacteria bacterium]
MQVVRKRIIWIAASLSLASAGANAQNYLDYASVKYGFEEGNGGTDFFQMYKEANIRSGLTRERVPHALNLEYGKDPKQRLDVFMPQKKPTNAPVFLFLHGGAFEEGDRAHYGYVSTPLAAHGVVTVVASYRLIERGPANKIHYRDQEEDTRAIIVWIYKNIAQYGGDPNRIFVSGHSAGALLAANAGTDRQWMTQAGLPKTALRGVAAISGGYADWSTLGWLTYAAPTPAERARLNPVSLVKDPTPAFILARGEKETNERFMKGIVEMKSALLAKAVQVNVAIEPGADHGGAVLALYNEDSPLTKAILQMIEHDKR